jgi:hypothetical protein
MIKCLDSFRFLQCYHTCAVSLVMEAKAAVIRWLNRNKDCGRGGNNILYFT